MITCEILSTNGTYYYYYYYLNLGRINNNNNNNKYRLLTKFHMMSSALYSHNTEITMEGAILLSIIPSTEARHDMTSDREKVGRLFVFLFNITLVK